MNSKSRWFAILVCCLALAAAAAGWQGIVTSQASASNEPALLATATPDPIQPSRESEGNPQKPEISFIDNPSPTCFKSAQSTGACTIQWNYFYVSASASSYMVTMTVSIDGSIRANSQGFFQTEMYLPGGMFGPGFQVSCGFPGSGGKPDLGSSHSYTIRARDTSGLESANHGSVYCPPDVIKMLAPLIMKR